MTVKNTNYAGTVITVQTIKELENSDNLVAVPIYGMQAIVGKDTKLGDRFIMFPAETQLSEHFTEHNNLYRKAELNQNKEKTGYLEENRRVKAIKLRGHRSDALLLPLESLSVVGMRATDYNKLPDGYQIDEYAGTEICRKYEVVRSIPRDMTNKNTKKAVRIDDKQFPEHFDTDNFWRNADKLSGKNNVVLTQKLHGTSARFGNLPVKRDLSWFEKLLKRLGIKVQETAYDTVYGSRRVIKNDATDLGFYGTDLWGKWARRLQDRIPKNYIVYGEIIGWVDKNTPIQKNYTYDLPNGNSDFYVYRVAVINPDGLMVDLDWENVRRFCEYNGLNHVPELCTIYWEEFAIEPIQTLLNPDSDKHLLNNSLAESGVTFRDQMVPLSNKDTVDEGVAIREDGWAPYILKAKSPVFLQHETKMLDEGLGDYEGA